LLTNIPDGAASTALLTAGPVLDVVSVEVFAPLVLAEEVFTD
jgi:hypothetical protein